MALARDAATGQFTETDGHGRSANERRVIAARRSQVENLYAEKTAAEIADEIDDGRWSKATIAKDVKALAALGKIEIRPAGMRRKYPDPQERECDNPDCNERFTPKSWEFDRRYCSRGCSQPNNRSELVRGIARQLLTEQHRRAAEEIARLNDAGYLTSSQLAAERKVTTSAVSRWISVGLLRAERRIIGGEPHQLIARTEFDRFNAEEWPRILDRMGRHRSYPPNWKRPAHLRWTGRLNGHKGAVAGFERGGRQPLATSEQQQQMLELDRHGKSSRKIAEEVFGDARYYKRVQRFLRR